MLRFRDVPLCPVAGSFRNGRDTQLAFAVCAVYCVRVRDFFVFVSLSPTLKGLYGVGLQPRRCCPNIQVSSFFSSFLFALLWLRWKEESRVRICREKGLRGF